MGINGLLQQLKSIARPTHVSAYRGQKVAIDGYSWLHKGAYGCSRELCEGIWTDGYVRYFVSRIDMLLGNGVVPIVVFDGCRLPLKADEEDNRRRSRREALERARAHAESGNMAAATEGYQRAVDIAPWMAKVVMEALRERNVTCLVAPYEADAQMSYLALRGDVHAVLTEDSDMLAYGCPRVLYKLDRGGAGEEVLLADLPLVRELNMVGFSHDMMLQMCIMAGCDFLPNMAGVGIKKAHAMMRKHRDFVKVLRFLRFNGSSPPSGYDIRFQRTIWLFRHQRVFCPASQTLTHLRPLPPGGLGAADVLVLAALPPEGPEREELAFLGPPMEQSIAAGIASGDLDPSTLQPFDLVSIYRGCPYPPRHLRGALQLPAAPSQQPLPFPALGPSSSQGQDGSGSVGHGTQRRLSWSGGGGGGPGTSSAGHGWGSQDHGRGPTQHPTHHYASQQQQQQQHHHHHHHQHPGGRRAGRPPVPPPSATAPDRNRSIKQFFRSHPAASQPFRCVVQPLAAGAGGGGGGVNREGCPSAGSGASAPVVTLRGLPVEVVDAGAGRSGKEGAMANANEDAADEQDDMLVARPSPKRRKLSPGSDNRPAASSGCGGQAAAGTASGGAGLSKGAAAASGSGSMFARFKLGAVQQNRSAGADGPVRDVDAPKSAAPEGPEGLGARSEPAFSREGGGDSEGLDGAAACADATGPGGGSQGPGAGRLLLRVDDGQEAPGLGGSLGGGAGAAAERGVAGQGDSFLGSQGRLRDWSSGAESDCQYDSQYDSQLTGGCGGTGWGGQGGGANWLGGRSRAPSRLAMEELFSQPSSSGMPSQQQQQQPHYGGSCSAAGGAGPGSQPGSLPCAGPVRPQKLGALEALLRQGSGGGGTAGSALQGFGAPGGSQAPCSSMSQLDPPPLDPSDHLGSLLPDCLRPATHGAPGVRAGAATDPAVLDTAAVAVAAAAGRPWASSGCPPPPQFSIYELDDEVDEGAAAATAPGRIGGALGGADRASSPAPSRSPPGGGCATAAHGTPTRRKLRGAGVRADMGDSENEGEDGEEEVTSPYKGGGSGPRSARGGLGPLGTHRLHSLGLRRRARSDGPQGLSRLLHPSALRRLEERLTETGSPGTGAFATRDTAEPLQLEAGDEGELGERVAGGSSDSPAGLLGRLPALEGGRARTPASSGRRRAGRRGGSASGGPRERPSDRWQSILDDAERDAAGEDLHAALAAERRAETLAALGDEGGAGAGRTAGLGRHTGGVGGSGGALGCGGGGDVEGDTDPDAARLLDALERNDARRQRRRRSGRLPAVQGLSSPEEQAGARGGSGPSGDGDAPQGGDLIADVDGDSMTAAGERLLDGLGDQGDRLQQLEDCGPELHFADKDERPERAKDAMGDGCDCNPVPPSGESLVAQLETAAGRELEQGEAVGRGEAEGQGTGLEQPGQGQAREQQDQYGSGDRATDASNLVNGGDEDDGDVDDDVLITADIAAAEGTGGGGGALGFHSIRHVDRFARVAQHALDRLTGTLEQPQQRHPAPSQQQQQQQPRQPRQQQGQGTLQQQLQRRLSAGGGGATDRGLQPPTAAAAGSVGPAGTTPPGTAGGKAWSDFAFVRKAPTTRRASAGRAGLPSPHLTGVAGGAARWRSSVFVPADGDVGEGGEGPTQAGPAPPERAGPAAVASRPGVLMLLQGQQARGVNPAGPAVASSGGGEEGGGSDGDDDVEIVEVGPAGLRVQGGSVARQSRAEQVLRRPFKPPRGSAGGGKGAGAGGGSRALGPGRGKGAGRDQQQPRITSFTQYAFGAGK